MQRAHHERAQIAGICSDDGDTNEHKERQRGSENEIHLGQRVRNKGCLEEGEGGTLCGRWRQWKICDGRRESGEETTSKELTTNESRSRRRGKEGKGFGDGYDCMNDLCS